MIGLMFIYFYPEKWHSTVSYSQANRQKCKPILITNVKNERELSVRSHALKKCFRWHMWRAWWHSNAIALQNEASIFTCKLKKSKLCSSWWMWERVPPLCFSETKQSYLKSALKVINFINSIYLILGHTLTINFQFELDILKIAKWIEK